MDIADKAIETVIEKAPVWGTRVVGVLVTLFLAWVVAGWIRRAIANGFAKRGFDASVAKFLGSLIRYAILAGALLACLGAFGVETTSFAALLGAAGLAIGLAFQNTLSNFSAGVMLLIFRPFKVDDVVNIGGEVGRVTEIDLFTTELCTGDNRKIYLPNAQVFGNKIENLTAYDTRRVEIPVGVAYDADIDKTRESLLAAVKEIDGVLEDPAPVAFLSDLGDSAVGWKLRVWCKTPDFWEVHQRGVRAVKKTLDAASIGIPFPQMDVHVDKP